MAKNGSRESAGWIGGQNEDRYRPIPLQMVDEKRSMIWIIRSRQRKWLGHIMRGDSLLRIIIEGRMEGKKTRGRPRMLLLDWMMEDRYIEDYSKLKESQKT